MPLELAWLIEGAIKVGRDPAKAADPRRTNRRVKVKRFKITSSCEES
jgi:hypothetical protein